MSRLPPFSFSAGFQFPVPYYCWDLWSFGDIQDPGKVIFWQKLVYTYERLKPMEKYVITALKILLLMVIGAELNSILQANINTEKYVQVFPGARGFLFYLSQITSLAALLNCILIWMRYKWAVWSMMLIGGWSIILLYILGGPLQNQIIILAATLGIVILSSLASTWFRNTKIS